MRIKGSKKIEKQERFVQRLENALNEAEVWVI
jgi:hypothetical protein